MSRWRDDPHGAADHLIVESLPHIGRGTDGPVLLVDVGPRLTGALAATPVVHLRRRLRPGDAAASFEWPPARPEFAGAFLRLPKDKGELVMTAHLLSARLRPGSLLIVYGGNDEGIRSAPKALQDLGPAHTVAAHSHGRVIAVQVTTPSTRGDLTIWREARTVPVPPTDHVTAWASYPGVFAGGGLDAGTELLLHHVPAVRPGARVLDFACGTGLIGAAVRASTPDVALMGIDNDALALLAAAENVPGATWHWGTSLAAVARQTFDLIVSNPPFHDGVREDGGIIAALIDGAPRHLGPDGQLCIVTQRRFALAPQLSAHFNTVTMTADEGQYRVWHATGPLRPKPSRR